MSREEHAREGAQAVIPDDEVLDVAVVMPRGSTFAGVLGAAAGVAGGGGGNTMAWGVAGGMIGERVNAASKGSYPSLVLALSPERLYVLGRQSTGLVGGWRHLHPVAEIMRNDLEVTTHRHGTVLIIGLTDKTTNTTLEVEAQNVGGLGLKELLGEVAANGVPADDIDGGNA
jgi:hypothetical protein